MNLLFTLDVNYIEPLKKCISSILRFERKEGWDIFLITEDTEQFQREFSKDKMPKGVRMHIIEAESEIFKAFPETGRYSRVVYFRIFAASVLPITLDRVLYLDPDIIVINPLDELYETDFENNYYIACSHTKGVLTDLNRVRLGIKKDVPYINSGVMLMNLELLRREQGIKSVYDYVRRKGKYFILPDQDIITAVYGDRVKLADTYRFNLSDRLIVFNNVKPLSENIDIEWVKKNAVIIHYYGDNKPWKERYSGILDVFYNEVSVNALDDKRALEK